MAQVDLTENRQYSSLKDGRNLLQNLNHDWVNRSIAPSWELQFLLTEFKVIEPAAPDAPLVWTGSSDEILLYEEVLEMENGDRCPCCGEKLYNIPWDPMKWFCPDCDARIGGQKKTPWENKPERDSNPWWLDV